jgi:hypothetical protein
MKAALLTRLVLFTPLTIVFLSMPLLAQPQVEKEVPYKGPIYIKPAKPLAPFDVKIRSFDADGEMIELYYVSTPYFGIEMKKPTGWSRKKDSNTSISYYFRGNPQTIFSMSLYLKSAFMPNVGPAEIKGYIEGLKKRHKGNIEILNDDGYYRPTNQTRWPLGKLNRVVIYTTGVPGSGKKIKYYEHFLVLNKFVFVGSISGPEQVVDKVARKSFEALFFKAGLVGKLR